MTNDFAKQSLVSTLILLSGPPEASLLLPRLAERTPD